MINSEPGPDAPSKDGAVDAILQAGARGAVALAGIATAIVIALWLTFYVLVFLARGTVS